MSRNNAGLSRERIVAEALRIIDGMGLRSLTMRRLGDALNVEAMAIYHHFPLGENSSTARSWSTSATLPGLSPPPSRNAPEDEATPKPILNPSRGRGPAAARLGVRLPCRPAPPLGALPLSIHRRPDTVAACAPRNCTMRRSPKQACPGGGTRGGSRVDLLCLGRGDPVRSEDCPATTLPSSTGGSPLLWR